MMDEKWLKTIKMGLYFVLLYLATILFFRFAAGDMIKFSPYHQISERGEKTLGEIIDHDVIVQNFEYSGDYMDRIILYGATYGRKNNGNLTITLIQNDDVLAQKVYDISKIKDNERLTFPVKKELTKGTFMLTFSTSGCAYGNAITFYTDEQGVHRGDLLRNGEKISEEFSMEVQGGTRRWLGMVYWKLAFFLIPAVFFFSAWLYHHICYSKGKHLKGIQQIKKYQFLIKQLVSRDFKTKYKRSALGFFWSFLNPLLTMLVQYVVFSTIFRSDIENFPVYLLSAGILFNFFTESVGAGLLAIVGNVSLITKVYVPKYIYPLSRVLSTAINLLISSVPLLIAVLVTGEPITRAFLLIPYVFLCVTFFCIGMSFLLSASMVFFRDTQFLWGIISLIWMYATPIFYPENIIPQRFQFVLEYNPMYHFLKFFRTILLTGRSPDLIEYFLCMGFAVIIFCIGFFVFKKTERKFVLYL